MVKGRSFSGFTPPYEVYSVSRSDREPLLRYALESLVRAKCSILFCSQPNIAPFRIVFETHLGERVGVLLYAFYANSKITRNRPEDEWRFQIKYGSDFSRDHEIAQDPSGLYTTLLCGISPEEGIFVGADPWLHNPTRFSKSVEFKTAHLEEIKKKEWTAWERETQRNEPIEILVGGTSNTFLNYVFFEREALHEDQGHRQLLAEQYGVPGLKRGLGKAPSQSQPNQVLAPNHLHQLCVEFDLDTREVLDLISQTRMLKMATRGAVAELHLQRFLSELPGVSECQRLPEGPDISLRYKGSKPVLVECKNVLRGTSREGFARVDFQRTRASKADPCSRFYKPSDFDIVAACMHPVTEKWEFQFKGTGTFQPHSECKGRLSNRVLIDNTWTANFSALLRA